MRRPLAHRQGEWGENQAAAYLKKKGYRVVGLRVRVDQRDEIDIVARDGKAIVFAEVKTRKNERMGRPVAAVDRAKREVLSRAAVRFLKERHLRDVFFRFDVVEVIGEEDAGAPTIRHIENAFPLSARYRYP